MGFDVSPPHVVFSEQGEVAEYGLTPIEAAREKATEAMAQGWRPATLEESLAYQLERDRGPERLSSPPVSPGGLGGKEKLSFAPLSSALANIPSEPAWTWDGYLGPGSITLWAGRPKVGKSTKLFGLFEAIIEGKPFLDRPTRATGVLLLSEEREGTLAEKARRWNLDGRVHLLMRHQANGCEWSKIVPEAVAYCQEHGLGVLAVDTWDKWTGLKGDAENNAGAVVAALEPLIHAAGSGLSVLIVAHQRKSLGEFGEAVRGSNALIGGVDIVAELERPRSDSLAGDGVRILRAVSRYSSTPEELVLALTEDGYEARGDSLVAEAEAQQEQVYEALDAFGEASYEQLGRETGLSESTLRRRIDELDGRVSRIGAGRRNDPFRFVTTPTIPTGGGKENRDAQLDFEVPR